MGDKTRRRWQLNTRWGSNRQAQLLLLSILTYFIIIHVAMAPKSIQNLRQSRDETKRMTREASVELSSTTQTENIAVVEIEEPMEQAYNEAYQEMAQELESIIEKEIPNAQDVEESIPEKMDSKIKDEEENITPLESIADKETIILTNEQDTKSEANENNIEEEEAGKYQEENILNPLESIIEKEILANEQDPEVTNDNISMVERGETQELDKHSADEALNLENEEPSMEKNSAGERQETYSSFDKLKFGIVADETDETGKEDTVVVAEESTVVVAFT